MTGSIRSLLFGVFYAVVFLAARLAILLHTAGSIAPWYLAGIGVSALADFAGGTILHYAASRWRRRVFVLATLALFTVMLTVLKIASFHYEAVFQRPPSAELVFYLDQLQYLSPSLAANLPPGRFIAACLGISALLLGAWVWIDRRYSTSGMPRSVITAAAAAMLLGIIAQAFPAVMPNAMYWASREPLVWLLQSRFVRERYELDDVKLHDEDFIRFRELHGLAGGGLPIDRRYPLCRAVPSDSATPQHRNVVILILESVGYAEMTGEFAGRELMPNLRRFAEGNLSFERVKAPGIKSIQTLPALFSGLPPNPFFFYLWQTPLPALDGVPRMLRDAGYRTAYFHGADLNFERQRAYLELAGFEWLFDFASFRDATPYGWGYDDDVLFDELLAYLERAQREAAPYLVTAATLSTHDPYVLPPEWEPVFSTQTRVLRSLKNCCTFEGEQDNRTALAETYRFLDAQLGRFFDWYARQQQQPLLLIVGDHAPYLPQESARAEHRDLRFHVPLLIAGLSEAQLEQGRRAAGRLAGLHDVPATLLALLGMRGHPCMLGLDLLAPEDAAARGRFVYAVAPESLDKLHVWHDVQELVYNRITGGFRIERDGAVKPTPAALADASRLLQNMLPVHYYLLKQDVYFLPRPDADRDVAALPAVRDPLIVSHRANRDGSQAPRLENSRAALERLKDSAFEWVELDVQLTRDGVPVLAHDPEFETDGGARRFAELPLDEIRAQHGFAELLTLEEALADYGRRFGILIEAKPQTRMDRSLLLARQIAEVLRRQPPRKGVIVDSFDEGLALSIRQLCRCTVGVDAQQGRRPTDDELRHFRSLGFDWIYVEHGGVDADLIRAAHAHGLKVMAYTVNEAALFDRWQAAGELPDGIITDYQRLHPGGG